MAASDLDVAAVRRFNRFFTRRLGLLDEGLAKSPFPLPEARVLYELAQRGEAGAAALASDLSLDPGYMSRLVASLRARRLIKSRRSVTDRRRTDLTLSAAGRAAFAKLEATTQRQIAEMLAPLGGRARANCIRAMRQIEAALGEAQDDRTLVLRPHRPGDMGWVVSRHGALYAEEYGWDITFEAMVADIAAAFIRSFDPVREACWIAELDCQPVGSGFVVKDTEEVAKLRMLIVEPEARGFGVGQRLVGECIAFARSRGYRRITLWTNDVLTAARAIYVKAGFTLVRTEPHRSFGKDLVGEYWEKPL